ncbi:hypothetical protein FHS19_001692 [Paenibacillus rhizosphaerae]|uniref:Uncharacterized protein n=1 Tax=Paenibacillus rhizosphaerae TaxID=297318 RepID=A0A839TNN8_9BACL|nr:hypothetical protein [Paenibacillus rhizosphaerae]
MDMEGVSTLQERIHESKLHRLCWCLRQLPEYGLLPAHTLSIQERAQFFRMHRALIEKKKSEQVLKSKYT